MTTCVLAWMISSSALPGHRAALLRVRALLTMLLIAASALRRLSISVAAHPRPGALLAVNFPAIWLDASGQDPGGTILSG